MYRLSEIAEKFNLERAIIIETLMSRKLMFDNHIQKKMGITYVDDRGIEILYKLLLDSSYDNKDENQISEEKISDEYKHFIEEENKIKKEISKLKNEIEILDNEINKENKKIIAYQKKNLKLYID